MANRPFEHIGVPEQATNAGSDEYTPTYSTMMLGGLDLMNQSSWEDLLVSPQTESVQPMDYGPGDSGGIEMETGTEGFQYAPDMGRHAPLALHLGDEPFQPTVNMDTLHMHGSYGNDSIPVEASGSPCTTDRQYVAATPITPLEEQGSYCPSPALNYQPPSVSSVVSDASSVAEDTIEQEVPNEASYGKAVRLADALSDPEEGSDLVHGRLSRRNYSAGPLPQAQIAKPQVQCDRTQGERVIVQYKLPSYVQTMEEFIKTSSLEEDGGYYCMEAFMRVVRKLEHLHSKLRCGHGAFSDLSSIRMRVSRRTRDLVTILIPELSKLAKAMELADLMSDERLASMGMVNDIKSLGNLLRTLLPFLRNKQIHVSEKLLMSLETACTLCDKATSRGDMAKIAQALNFKKRLCTLHVKFPPQCRQHGMCTLDIVCYEGENIYEVISRAWMDWKTVESYGCKLSYEQSELPVGKDNEVFFPVCKAYLTMPFVPGRY